MTHRCLLRHRVRVHHRARARLRVAVARCRRRAAAAVVGRVTPLVIDDDVVDAVILLHRQIVSHLARARRLDHGALRGDALCCRREVPVEGRARIADER